MLNVYNIHAHYRHLMLVIKNSIISNDLWTSGNRNDKSKIQYGEYSSIGRTSIYSEIFLLDGCKVRILLFTPYASIAPIGRAFDL